MQSFPIRKKTIPIYPLPAMAVGNANLFAQRARLFKKGCTEPNEAKVSTASNGHPKQEFRDQIIPQIPGSFKDVVVC